MPDYRALEQEQQSRLATVKAQRDHAAVAAAIAAVKDAAAGATPLMEPIIAAVRVRATLGEISDALRAVWGTYRGAGG
jgi:methylmalonyl-CoA mutase N-terminal domain/subunit